MVRPTDLMQDFVGQTHLDVKECVEIRDNDVFVLHLAPHVLDGVDRRLIVRLRAAAEGQLLHPQAAHLK